MTPPQEHFAGPRRPLEELYDCQLDPQNLENLASSSEHSGILERMRGQLAKNLVDSRDLGFLPESLAWQLSEGTTSYELARSSGDYDQSIIIEAASQVGSSTEAELLANLAHSDPGVRYWGAVGLSAAPSLSEKAIDALTDSLDDAFPNARIEAANALARHGELEQSIPALAEALSDEDLIAVQHAVRAIELLGEKAIDALPAVQACDARMKGIRPPGTSPVVVDPEKDQAMFVGFSTEAFLARFGTK